MRQIVLLGIFLFVSLSSVQRCANAAPADTLHTKSKSPTGALLRSLVIPGWGQLYNEQYLKAAIAFGIETSLALSASYQNDQVHRYEKKGESDAAKFYRNDRNRLIWWLAGFALFSMGDAYVDAHLFNYDISPNLSLDITPTTGLTFRWNAPKLWR
jgi:hypothetical protein